MFHVLEVVLLEFWVTTQPERSPRYVSKRGAGKKGADVLQHLRRIRLLLYLSPASFYTSGVFFIAQSLLLCLVYVSFYRDVETYLSEKDYI